MPPKKALDPKVAAVLRHALMREAVDWAIGNFTNWSKKPHRKIKTLLRAYAAASAEKVIAGDAPMPDMANDPRWRITLSERAYALVDYSHFAEMHGPAIRGSLNAILGEDRAWIYGHALRRIAQYASSVAYMVKNDLDPELLRI